MAGGVSSLFGEQLRVYVAVPGKVIDIREGTKAAPTNVHNGPAVSVHRSVTATSAELASLDGAGADGGNRMATMNVISYSPTGSEVQNVAFLAGAHSDSTTGTAGNDACGIYGIGRHTGNGTGIGAFIIGRRETSSGRANALEADCGNYGGVAGVYQSAGFSNTTGIWCNALGNADSAVGLNFGNPFGFQYAVGIGFNAQVNNAKTGGIRDSTIRDLSTSTISLDIQGTHTTALSIAAGAGAVSIGVNNIGLNGATPVAKGNITGAKGGNAALASLLSYLASRGDITDSTGA